MGQNNFSYQWSVLLLPLRDRRAMGPDLGTTRSPALHSRTGAPISSKPEIRVILC